MAPQYYKVFITHAHDISGWTILSRILHSRSPHLGGMNYDVQYDLTTLALENGEQLEDFHSRDSQTPEINYALWRNFLPYQTSLTVHEGIDKE